MFPPSWPPHLAAKLRILPSPDKMCPLSPEHVTAVTAAYRNAPL